ncbi:mitochondrial mRNA pseudouridine synthase Rpusd3 [Calliopsis andreniformis]|uniref:mitochondrial mRNA pseudouridine synthase Rpusd3 n=1 Tax=Calliopsis andreniformis TaxID=337506 RepID=UPI003FCD10C7
MENLTSNFRVIICMCAPRVRILCTKICKRNYMENVAFRKSNKSIHPYNQIHPWKSFTEFSKDLVNNVIYNQDGLVALNKPYGISVQNSQTKSDAYIPNATNYGLKDALPYIAQELNYSELTIVRKPEKYMTGVTLLSANSKVQNAVELSLRRGQNFTKTYWMITTRVPHQIKGKAHLGIKLAVHHHLKSKQPIILTLWSNNDVERKVVKILNTEFMVLSNSTLNLCSLIKIKSSTNKWYALRLFAATYLYCPVLGDNSYASRIQKIGDTYVQVNPFMEYTKQPPVLDKSILKLLNLKSSQQHIIPVHIHLKSIGLPSFLEKGKDLTIEAPLIPPFDWTCKQLEFKNI